MRFIYQKKEKGYVALMSVIVISLILLGLTTILSMSGYFSRFNVLNGEYKRVSLGLAESCANVALLKIAQNPNYTGGETISVGTNNCTIKSVTYDPPMGYDVNNQKIANISTWAQFPLTNSTFSNMEISAVVQDPRFSPPSMLTLRGYVYGGTKLPSDFAPYRVSGTVVDLDTPKIFPTGSYIVTQNNDSNYNTTYSADCDPFGNVDIGFNDNKTCVVVNTFRSTTANLTVIAEVVNNYGGPTKSPNDFTLYIDGIELRSGQSRDLSTEPGLNNHKATAGSDPDYTPGDWSLPCAPNGDIILNSGDPPQTCKVTYYKNPPPSPSCADTLMMLDRTGSMSSTDLTNERAAAKGLLNLYSPLSPPPQVGVGSFGGLDGSGAQVPTNGQLTNIYGSDSIASDTSFKSPSANVQNSSGDSWSNANNAYVDGGGYAYDNNGHRHRYYNFNFSVLSDSNINGIEVKTDAWSTASVVNIWVENFGTSGNNSNDIPNWEEEGNDSDSTTLAQAAGSGDNSSSPNGGRFALIGDNEWICRSVNASGLSGLVLNYYWRGDMDAEDGEAGSVQYFTGGSCDSPTGLVTIITHELDNNDTNSSSWSSLQTINLSASLNNTSFNIRFRNGDVSSSNENFRVDGVTVSGMPASSSCQLGVDLSWNGGSSWTSEKTQTLTGSEATYTLGGSSDKWGRTWSASNFSNSNFRVRVHQIGSGCIANLDWLQAKIHYSIATGLYATINQITGSNSGVGTNLSEAINVANDELNSPRHQPDKEKVLILISDGDPNEPGSGDASREAALDSADSAKLNDIKIFTIHFGTDPSGFPGQELLASLSSGNVAVPSHSGHSGFNHELGSADDQSSAAAENADGDNFYISPTSADMEGIFEDIGRVVCPAVGGGPPPTPSPPTITVITEIFNNYGGSKQPSDVIISIPTAVDPNQRSLPGKAWPGDNIIVAEGSYNITSSDLDNYTKSSGCTGTISAGSNQTCKITYNQNAPPPPSPPPPLPNITIDTWIEKP